MSKGVRNLLVRAGGAVASMSGSRPGKRAVVLHEVPDLARFEQFLDWLASEYEILPLSDWLTAPRGDRTQLILTFDDGYASWQESVAPLLVERDLPATYFVTSGMVGLRGQEARDFARERLGRTGQLEFIDLGQLRELAQHPGFEFGSHTMTHADLGRIAGRDAIRDEVVGARTRLEDWLARPVPWFAYPFGAPGHISPRARRLVEEIGMSAAFTLVPGAWDPAGGDRFLIGRDGPDPSLPFSVWRAWLRGGYDRLYALKDRLRPSRTAGT